MLDSGHFFYVDSYEAQYDVSWEKIGQNIDITTIIRQPYIWGEEPTGFIKNHTLFRFGVITVQRQIIKPLDDGYELVSEGVSQYQDYIQMNFNCGGGPADPFKYYLDCDTFAIPEFRVTDGSCWSDPDISDTGGCFWGDDSTEDSLEWIDVWK